MILNGAILFSSKRATIIGEYLMTLPEERKRKKEKREKISL